MKNIYFFIPIFLVFILFTCNEKEKETLNIKEYLKWVNEENHGLVKSKTINNIKLTVKYLPTDLLVSKEIENFELANKQAVDSLKSIYKHSIYFMMSLEAQKDGIDIMKKDIYNYKSYAERFVSMNFNLEKDVLLKLDGRSFSPVLSNFENTYGLSTKRDIIFVFTPSSKEEIDFFKNRKEIDFIYRDYLFELGINHFIFKEKDLQKIPKLQY